MLRALTRRVRAAVVDFLRDTRGGAMAVACIGAATIMMTGGAGLINLAWHEAHREEVRAAMRAAVASVGASLLARAGDGGKVDEAIAERVEAFVEAATPTEVDDVSVDYKDGRIGVELEGSLDVDDLWGAGRAFFGGGFTETVAVELTSTRHEFALALDVSGSMSVALGTGTRMDALKAALGTVASNLEAAQRTSPAGMLVSVVPFASAVRLADIEGAGRTRDKALYLRLMGGRTRAKWVDVYHHYGVGGTHEIPVPAGWNWDANRFTGCFMARWGAYWETRARPTPLAWPATHKGEPLHLSDAAPVRRNPNTLFSPYSWPDAGPAGNIDARLQWAMADLLAGRSPTGVRDWFGDNDWSLPDGGGDALCPESKVMPLTDRVSRVRAAVADLRPAELGPADRGATYPHLGVVWGMRTLAAGWRNVWKVKDFRKERRPLPAAPDLHKTILVLTDGEANGGRPLWGQVHPRSVVDGRTINPADTRGPACRLPRIVQTDPPGSSYDTAAERDDAAFNASFDPDWRTGLADALGVPALATRLAAFEPVDAFRGTSAAFADVLADAGLPRPTQFRRHLCDHTSVFGPYGRLGDPLYVGGDPVLDGAPWSGVENLRSPYEMNPLRNLSDHRDGARNLMAARLYAWWDAACALAAARDIKVHTVFLGDDTTSTSDHLAALRRCSASTGGESFVTPDADTLDDAFDRLIRIRRTLRFVD